MYGLQHGALAHTEQQAEKNVSKIVITFFNQIGMETLK